MTSNGCQRRPYAETSQEKVRRARELQLREKRMLRQREEAIRVMKIDELNRRARERAKRMRERRRYDMNTGEPELSNSMPVTPTQSPRPSSYRVAQTHSVSKNMEYFSAAMERVDSHGGNFTSYCIFRMLNAGSRHGSSSIPQFGPIGTPTSSSAASHSSGVIRAFDGRQRGTKCSFSATFVIFVI